MPLTQEASQHVPVAQANHRQIMSLEAPELRQAIGGARTHGNRLRLPSESSTRLGFPNAARQGFCNRKPVCR